MKKISLLFIFIISMSFIELKAIGNNLYFYDYKDDLISQQFLLEGQTTSTIPTNATRSGYHIGGWTDNTSTFEADLSDFTMPNYDVHLYVQEETSSYDITFFDYDNSIIETISYNYQSRITDAPTSNRGGYDFIGWSWVMVFGETEYVSQVDLNTFTMPVSNVTFRAEYEKKPFIYSINIDNLEVEAGHYDIEELNDYINSELILSESYETNHHINFRVPNDYDVTVNSNYRHYSVSDKFILKVKDTLKPTFYKLKDQIIPVGSNIDWKELINRVRDNSSLETNIRVLNDIDFNTIGTYEVTMEVYDSSLNKTTDTFKVTVTNNLSKFSKLTYKINKGNRLMFDVKKTVGYYDNYKLNVEIIENNIDFSQKGIYQIIVKTSSILKASKLDTIIIKIIE